MSEIRVPIQKRSIEKRNKIIEKGFELMCKSGYFNVTAVDIANYAGISTGIIYQYFNDKKDIFIEGVKNYANKIIYPMIDILEDKKIDLSNINELISKIIDSFINTHKMSKFEHENLLAMAHLDENVANVFKDNEIAMTKKIVSLLDNNNIYLDNSFEKVHLAINIVEDYCHEVIYHKHKDLDYEKMKIEVINLIKFIIK